ncbi:MAG: YlxR family protein [Eubacterium sp.]|nr:YlxR family protein [Eubacterium sp.]
MKNKKIPMRRCIACGTSRPKQELIRIVTTETPADAGTGKMTEVDPTGRKNGRGAYLCKNTECYMLAKKKHLISETVYEELSKE